MLNTQIAMPDQLSPLIERYRGSLGGKAADLDAAFTDAGQGAWRLEAREQFQLLIHRLAGSASSYGFTDIGDLAVGLDLDLQRAADEGWQPDSDFLDRYGELQGLLSGA